MAEAGANKRVAKNAVALTLRMVLVTIVGLYTSRIVLQALGIDDYGIYGVIGGVVGMASFLNSSMAGATSRFITFELGKGNQDKLKKIFSTAFIVHLIIAAVVAILAETVGLWFVNNKMNFPEGSIFAVNVLYQFTILSMVVNFTQVPYSADIIAHEKMDIYAYFEIINVALKLGIVYLLLVVNTDRLILYAALTLCVSVISAMIYRLYCVRHFSESHIQLRLDKKIMKQMLSFSGYDLYGNMCVVANTQGIPIVLNLFFGVIANAGASIATTVTGTLKAFASTTTQAFRPQIIKLYASNDIVTMRQMMRRAVQFSLLIYGIIAIPLFLDTSQLIYIWLGEIPQYSVEFIRLILISMFFNLITLVSNAAIHATGNIRNISFISGTFFLLSPFVSWILLKFYVHSANIVYCVDIFSHFAAVCLGVYFVHSQIRYIKIWQYIWSIFLSTICVVVSFFLIYHVGMLIEISKSINSFGIAFLDLLVTTIVNTFVLCALTYFIVFNKDERDYAVKMIKRKLTVLFHFH